MSIFITLVRGTEEREEAIGDFDPCAAKPVNSEGRDLKRPFLFHLSFEGLTLGSELCRDSD